MLDFITYIIICSSGVNIAVATSSPRDSYLLKTSNFQVIQSLNKIFNYCQYEQFCFVCSIKQLSHFYSSLMWEPYTFSLVILSVSLPIISEETVECRCAIERLIILSRLLLLQELFCKFNHVVNGSDDPEVKR